MKILFITPKAVHDKVGHAGGKTLNFYLDKFSQDADFEVGLAYLGDFCRDYELMLEQYASIKFFSAFKTKKLYEKLRDGFKFRYIYAFLRKINPKYYVTNNFNKKRLINILKNVQTSHFFADVIIAEFADPIYWVAEIKKVFPQSSMVASCHDVTFLSVKRALQNKNKLGFFDKMYFDKFKKTEIKHLNMFNLVVPHNSKDKALLKYEPAYGNVNTHVIAPYYDRYELTNSGQQDAIVFFGAMYRLENQDAVDWFLKNVWPAVNEFFKGTVKFLIVGGGLPIEKRSEYVKNKNVEVLGFVPQPEDVFGTAFCFVVPLRLGAGIKVKVLEAMYAGMPVVTNEIGMEGIPGSNNHDYTHCESPDDFIKSIIRLKIDHELRERIGKNSKKTISDNFDLQVSYIAYKNAVKDLIKKCK